jgi:hypothetical protein
MHTGGVKVSASYSVMAKATNIRLLHNSFYRSGYEAIEILRKDIPPDDCRGAKDKATDIPLDLRYCHEDISGLRILNNQVLNASLLDKDIPTDNYLNWARRFLDTDGVAVDTYTLRPFLKYDLKIENGLESEMMSSVKVAGNLFNHPDGHPIMCSFVAGKNCKETSTSTKVTKAIYDRANALSDADFLTYPAIRAVRNINAVDSAAPLTQVYRHEIDSNVLLLTDLGFFLGYTYHPGQLSGPELITLNKDGSITERSIVHVDVIEAGGQTYERIVVDAPILTDMTDAWVTYPYSGSRPDIGIVEMP